MTTTRGRTRRAGGSRREPVLDAVIEVLVDRGYGHARFRDVADHANVAISTLQGYFGSREDMLVEALRRATDKEVDALRAAAVTVDDPWQRMVALVERGLATPLPVWRMLMEFWTAAAHDDELRACAAELAAQYRAPFDDAALAGIAAGAFQPRRAPLVVVDALVATLDGTLFPLVLGHARSNATDLADVVLDQLAGALGVDR